jgi:hypothetical protein
LSNCPWQDNYWFGRSTGYCGAVDYTIMINYVSCFIWNVLHCHWYVFLDGSQGVVHFLTLDQAKFPPDFSKMLVGNPALRVSLGCEQAFLCQMIAVWFVFLLSEFINVASHQRVIPIFVAEPAQTPPAAGAGINPLGANPFAAGGKPGENPFAWGLNHRRKCPRSWGVLQQGSFLKQIP